MDLIHRPRHSGWIASCLVLILSLSACSKSLLREENGAAAETEKVEVVELSAPAEPAPAASEPGAPGEDIPAQAAPDVEATIAVPPVPTAAETSPEPAGQAPERGEITPQTGSLPETPEPGDVVSDKVPEAAIPEVESGVQAETPTPDAAPVLAPEEVTKAVEPSQPAVITPPEPPPAPSFKPAPDPAGELASETAPQVAPPPQAPEMDMDRLGTRLRKTKAIGLFTKLELKSQVEDLLDDLEDYHASKSTLSLNQLEENFNLLVMKLMLLLQDDDPQLHGDIVRARPALWTTLADPNQFATLKGP